MAERNELLVNLASYVGDNIVGARSGIPREFLKKGPEDRMMEELEHRLKHYLFDEIKEKIEIINLSEQERERRKKGEPYRQEFAHFEEVLETRMIVFTPKEFGKMMMKFQEDIVIMLESEKGGTPQ